MDTCRRVLADLGLPEVAANPLVARAFTAHLRPQPQISSCTDADFEAIYSIINDAAQAYYGVIPDDRWHEPYVSREELRHEIESGVRFWGYKENGELLGVMGIQDVQDVTLIRHSYVRTAHRSKGIGGKLLCELRRPLRCPLLHDGNRVRSARRTRQADGRMAATTAWATRCSTFGRSI